MVLPRFDFLMWGDQELTYKYDHWNFPVNTDGKVHASDLSAHGSY